jgi:hypothetical protein
MLLSAFVAIVFAWNGSSRNASLTAETCLLISNEHVFLVEGKCNL